MTESFTLLDFAQGAVLVRDIDAPMLYAVWLNDDIIGAGPDSETAVAEARETVATWAKVAK